MSTIGYYNYYNNIHRYTTDTVIDSYSQMVERYNSDDLHANNENPYSEENLAIRALDEKLAPMAEAARSRFKTQDEVHQYLSEKYFGTSDFVYTKKWDEPETYAMYENDYNAICYGTVSFPNLNDPRLNYTQQDWATTEAEERASKQQAISGQMKNLLNNNGIQLNSNDSLLININPYDFDVQIKGNSNLALLKQITDTLKSNNNSKELFHYAFQTTDDKNSDSVNKYRAYQNTLNLTGYKLSELELKDGEYYTQDGQNILDLLKSGIEKDSSIGLEFKGAAYEYGKSLLDKVAAKGWNNIADLNLSIGYSTENGFFSLGKTYEA